MQHPAPQVSQQPATPAPALPSSPAPAIYFGDRIAMTVWFGGAVLLGCVLVVKELAAVLLPR
jgi:hypothetical protein